MAPFSSDTGTLQTDRQTDRHTDRIAISISRVSVLMCDKNGNAVIYTSATHGDNLLSNDGLSSGNSRQH